MIKKDCRGAGAEAQMAQAGGIWEEGASTEKFPSGRPVGMSVGHFIDQSMRAAQLPVGDVS